MKVKVLKKLEFKKPKDIDSGMADLIANDVAKKITKNLKTKNLKI